jgi:hypothetical protein
MSQLGLFARWLDTVPEVPDGQWFKRFSELIVCGEGTLVKTFLRSGQIPAGEEVNQLQADETSSSLPGCSGKKAERGAAWLRVIGYSLVVVGEKNGARKRRRGSSALHRRELGSELLAE